MRAATIQFFKFMVPIFVTAFTVACGNISKDKDGNCSDSFMADYNLVNQRSMGSNAFPVILANRDLHRAAKDACDRFYSRHADIACPTIKRTSLRIENLSSGDLKAQCDAIQKRADALK